MTITFTVDDASCGEEIAVSLENEATRLREQGMPGTAAMLTKVAVEIRSQLVDEDEQD